MRSLWLSVLCLGCTLCACGSDSGGGNNNNNDSEDCEALHCDAINGGRSKACFIIDGKARCEHSCFGYKETGNDPVCWRNTSYADPKWETIVDTCAKDDNGHLYVKNSEFGSCSGGCDKGVCTEEEEPSCDDLHCDRIAGGREHGCFILNGEAQCKPNCLGSKEGKNDPVCWYHGSINPPTWKSVADICAKDDNGQLYSTDSNESVCSGDCSSSSGVCDKDVSDPCEELHCEQIVGGKVHECFIVDGEASCKITCPGDKEGENKPVCYRNGSLPVSIMVSILPTCAKDDNGKLYQEDSIERECPIGCTDGVCDQVKTCNDDNECLVDGGREQKCFNLRNGQKGCAPVCLADDIPFVFACYRNASIPDATYQSVIDYCYQDDVNNSYYSVDSEVYMECGNKGCNEETGNCIE